MSLFETYPFLSEPLFMVFLISCGFFIRVGALLVDWFINSAKQLWQRRKSIR